MINVSEYQEMAKYYDLFYHSKSYDKEVNFLDSLISGKKRVLDVGCGTGIHMQLLEEMGYQVDGLDLNKGMLDIARTRTKGNLFQGNLLNFEVHQKYDAIISMFAVFNHLQDYIELEKGILHWYENLNDNGILIIDLHNGRSNGEKENNYQNYKRIMKWQFDCKNFKEYTDIHYLINGKDYHDTHEFKIYEVDKIKEILDKNKLKYKLYENYSYSPANDNSKNIEIVIIK